MRKEVIALADFRADEGLRPRRELICPTLTLGLGGGGGLTRSILVIERWTKSRSDKQQNKVISKL